MTQVETIRLELPATLTYLNLAGACVAEMLKQAVSPTDLDATTYNTQLAVQEACVNIVRHAYEGVAGGRIDMLLTLASDPARLIVELNDTGNSFDWDSVDDPNLDEVHEHGYGLFLMRSLMDEVSYTARVEGNHWQLVKLL